MRMAGADKAVGKSWTGPRATADLGNGPTSWRDRLASVCDDLGIEPDALESTLAADGFDIVFACAAEDVLSRSFGDADRNVVDDCLKRRGWRESGTAKTYLRAFRASLISLYDSRRSRAGGVILSSAIWSAAVSQTVRVERGLARRLRALGPMACGSCPLAASPVRRRRAAFSA